ncbi:hypothetical protein BAZMOX_253380_0 [methanotrophic endosymbiont of Bathymodiolus azoricus (Menez Gwen)]|nr:hypothetical protein BAZMOX_253380_0 [methanotrophic endosymbiont of Bathymodiolus azoricus (Menez Gwen)]
MTALLYHFVNASLWLQWGLAERALNLAMWVSLGGAIYVAVLLLSGLKFRHLSAQV